MSAMLPAQFADLEAFAPRWCLGTEPERYRTRLGTSMEEMQAFYDAAAPRAEAAIAYLATLGLDELDGEDQRIHGLNEDGDDVPDHALGDPLRVQPVDEDPDVE